MMQGKIKITTIISKTEYKKMYSVEHPNTTLIITNQNLINIDNLDKLVSK